jgi:hypothetical protein
VVVIGLASHANLDPIVVTSIVRSLQEILRQELSLLVEIVTRPLQTPDISNIGVRKVNGNVHSRRGYGVGLCAGKSTLLRRNS